MKKLLLYMVVSTTCLLSASMYHEWGYGRAICSAQHERWAEAQQRMSILMVDDPDNPELLYDSGVAAYRLKEYQKAHAYFHQTIQNDRVSADLKERAYFNLGNTNAALDALEEAIDSYESALKIDPNDEHARYNLEKVRELLAQRKQQQEKQQRKGTQNQQQQDDKQQQHKEQRQKQHKKSNQDQQQKQQDGQKSCDDNNQKQNKGERGQEQRGTKEERNTSKGNEHQKQDADQQQEGDCQDDAHDKSERDGRNQKQEQSRDTHDPSLQTSSQRNESPEAQDTDAHHTKEGEKSQGMQSGELGGQGEKDMQAVQSKKLEEELAPHEQWMARLLQQRECADEKANKRIVKTMINKELAGKNGQNCW